MLKIGKLRLYLTWDYRLRNSQSRDQDRNHHGIVQAKERKWAATGGRCEICGKQIDKFKHSELHHVLAWWRFPQFEADDRNLMLLCHECHKSIHCDPFVQVRQLEAKAKELGVELKDYYDV